MRVALPPRSVLLRASGAVVVLAVPVAAAAVPFGTDTAVPIVLGMIGALVLSAALATRQALEGIAVFAVAAWLASAAAGAPVAALVVVAGACVAYGVGNLRHEAGLMLAPLVAVITAVDTPAAAPPLLGLLVLACSLYVLVLVRVLHVHLPTKPVPPRQAVAHAAVLTVAVTASSVPWIVWEWPHAYWLPLTILTVLRASPSLAHQRLWDRTRGTVTGVVLALILVVLLPGVVLVALLAPIVVMMVSSMMEDDYTRFVTWLTPMVVITAGTGGLDEQVLVAGERFGFTVAGVLVSLLAIALLPAEEPPRGATG